MFSKKKVLTQKGRKPYKQKPHLIYTSTGPWDTKHF